MTTLLLATAIYLNGVNIDGVRAQSFEKCRNVRIDEKGDVHLDCPGYQVEVPGAAAPAAASSKATPVPTVPVATASVAPSPTAITKHYFLVSEQKDGMAARYDVDVFVNSKFVRKVRAGEEQIVLDITRYLAPGTNKVLFAATKRAPAKPGPATSFLKLIVGEGESSGAQVLIDNPLLECKRTAAEIDNVNEEFTVQAR